MDPRWKKLAPGALVLLVCALVLARTLRQLARDPVLNWDMLPAMALALEWEERDPVALHARTYALAAAELAPERYAELTATGVRQIRARDPAAFHEHLPFYRGRVLYTLAVYALHRLGAPLSGATHGVPLVALALCALVFLAWGARHLPLAGAALLALGLVHTPALLSQARVSSADGLATLLVCLGAYLWLERGALALGAFVLTLAIGARPDTVLLVGALALAWYALAPRAERPPLRALAAWLALAGLVVLGLARFAGEYGWWPLMQISFVEKSAHPAGLATEVDWRTYGAILARQVAAVPGGGYTTTPSGEVTGSTLVFPYAAAAALALVLARRQARVAALLAALLAAYAARYFLFPQLWDRFYAPFYALVPLCLVSALAGELGARMRAS